MVNNDLLLETCSRNLPTNPSTQFDKNGQDFVEKYMVYINNVRILVMIFLLCYYSYRIPPPTRPISNQGPRQLAYPHCSRLDSTSPTPVMLETLNSTTPDENSVNSAGRYKYIIIVL